MAEQTIHDLPEPEIEAEAERRYNDTSFQPEPENSITPESITFISLYSLYIFLILFGNVILVIVILRNKKLQSPTNTYIISLASADLCIGLLVVPSGILAYFSEDYLVPLICKACEYFSHTAGAARIICMLTIAVDRYRIHTQKFSKNLMPWQCRRNVLIGWTVALLYAIRAPVIYNMTQKTTTDGSELTFMSCAVETKYITVGNAFLLIDFFCLYCIPLLLITTFYLSIVHKLSADSEEKTDPKYSDEHRRRMVIMLVVLMILFGICKLPIHVYNIYVYWGPGFFEGSERVKTVCRLLSFLNSWLNFITIMIFNDALRSAAQETFACSKKIQNEDTSTSELQLTEKSSMESSAQEEIVLF